MPLVDNKDHNAYQFLAGGGEMGALTRNFDWSATVLGSPATWSQSLLTTVSIILNSRFPMFLYWGEDLIQFYNDAYRPSLGNDGKHPTALGQQAKVCWVEIWPAIKPIIDNVLINGEANWSEDQLLPIYRNGKLEDVYWTFSYSPVKDDNGKNTGVFVTCTETTGKVTALKDLHHTTQELQSINEEMTASNEDLAAINEELGATNEELIAIQQELEIQTDEKQQALDALSASEENLRNMVKQAPVGMCILQGEPLYATEVNDSFLELIGKTREQLSQKPYWVVNAEAAAYYEPITDEVLSTGITYHAKEHEIMLIRKGVEEIIHVNFVYEPMKDLQGETFAIMIVAIDITSQVVARKKIELAEENLRMAIDAAEMGSFSMNPVDQSLQISDYLKHIFGFKPEDEVPYQAILNQIHPEYRKAVADAVTSSLTKGTVFKMDYPITGFHDQKPRWVTAIGTIQRDGNGKDVFAGVIHDVSEQKRDEQRKHDFIGMVSHELKTPLTSLTAYIQILLSKAKKEQDKFAAAALEKANNQAKKMTAMINGFLNVTRLESGKLQISPQQFDMSALIKEAEEETAATVNTHQIIYAATDHILVYADKDKIGQVISNLISNAIKYAKSDSIINVDCSIIDGQVQVSVKDSGMGISPADLDKVFDRYFRVEGNNMNNIAGFGIGLYLCAEIIQRHKGKIWVESKVGEGSTFYFSIPQ